MSRNSNDDRSDSMNPNNDAYHASEANHNNQIGGYGDDVDDDDVDLSESGKQRRARHFETLNAASNRGLVLLCDAMHSISQRSKKEQSEKK
jgi:hypothetical protein